jgi:hypothetical protein
VENGFCNLFRGKELAGIVSMERKGFDEIDEGEDYFFAWPRRQQSQFR